MSVWTFVPCASIAPFATTVEGAGSSPLLDPSLGSIVDPAMSAAFPWLVLGAGILAALVCGLGLLLWGRIRRRRERFVGVESDALVGQSRLLGRILLESDCHAVLAWDLDGRILAVSPAAERLFGEPAAKLMSTTLRSLIDDLDHDAYDHWMATLPMNTSAPKIQRPITFEAHRGDGPSLTLEMTALGTTWDEQPMGAALIRVVKRRNDAISTDSRSDTIRTLMEELPDAVMVHRDRRLVYVNRRFLRSLGFERLDEVVGRSIRDLVHPDDWEIVEGRLRQLEATGKAVDRAEERFRGAGGLEVTWEVSKVPIVFDGRSAVVALGRDVTGRRLAERRFRQVVESTPCGMIMADLDGRIVLANRQVESMFGFTETELVGQPIELLVPEQWRDRHPSLRRAYMLQPSTRPMGNGRNLFGLHADGTQIPVEIGLNPLQLDQGVFVLCSIVDISERKRAEGLVQVADRLATVGTLSAGVAHGINNPLSYVKGNLEYAVREIAQVIEESPGSDAPSWLAELKTALEHATEGANRIRDLVSDLLMFSRHDSDAEMFGGADVHRVLESVIQMTANEIRPRATLERHFEATSAVRGDSSRLAHAFTNLIVNAAHAVPEGAPHRHTISVDTRNDVASGDVIVEIRDTGEGMDEETQRHVFEPFYTTKPVGQGTGLGLSVTHGIIAELGGRTEIESEPGKGTLVRVVLPAADRSLDRSIADAPRHARSRVLVVDDEPRMLEMFDRLLRDDEVVTASDGSEALARIQAGERFDVIFCDMLMPGMTGSQLYGVLSSEYPDVARRMVFMTGGAFTTESRRFSERMRDRTINKPPARSELEAAIAAILDAPVPGGSAE